MDVRKTLLCMQRPDFSNWVEEKMSRRKSNMPNFFPVTVPVRMLSLAAVASIATGDKLSRNDLGEHRKADGSDDLMEHSCLPTSAAG